MNATRDLDTWAEELSEALGPLTQSYRRLRSAAEGRAQDDELSEAEPSELRSALTFTANQALAQIALALNRLPQVQELLRDGPIPDLLAALDDLDRGLNPALLQTTPTANGRLSTRIDMSKLRAAASVFMLKRAGMNDAPARRLVAKIFAEAGHTGKKGKPLSASTLFEWCTYCEPDPDGNLHQKILAKQMAKVRSDLTQSEVITLIKTEAAIRL
jgi:hypothetical protein